ncbi:hypothetical protein OSB04_020128 [Centaurea solstitialis]|uniref:Bifunctional inhibitor/plant lipid transfer protein/seed storage helical domain-containing protein n=1 Tax=Centaurea solstitialis TaxID=347529 RepID=A0AA38T3T6_9ASTR|nr:hypothetical protein OSB04_020128 [Centaurea solstitialis]
MASYSQRVMGVVLVVMVMVWGGARAQSNGCTNTLMGLAPCLNYVTGNTSTPSPSCCSQLSTVVQSQPRCLCSLLNGNAPNIGVTINQTLAITLPGACQVQTPPISQCNTVANGPASGPTSSAISPTASQIVPSQETPEAEAPTTSSTPTITPGSGSGSKTTPSTNNNASDGSRFGASSYLMFIVLFFGMKF